MKSLSKTISAEWRRADPALVQYCRKLAEADMRWYNEKMDRFLAEEQRQRDKDDTKTTKTNDSRPLKHPIQHPMQLPSRRSALPVVDGVLISPEDHPDKYYQMVHQMMNVNGSGQGSPSKPMNVKFKNVTAAPARDTTSVRYKSSSDVNAAGVLLSIQGQEPQEKMQRLMPGQASYGFNGKGASFSSQRADGTHAIRTKVPPFVLHAASEAAARHMQHQRPPPPATLNRNSSSLGYPYGFEHPPSAAPMMNRYSTAPSLHPPTSFNRHHSFPSSRGPPTLGMAMTLAKELCDLEAASQAELDAPFSPDVLRRMSNEELLALSNSLKLRRAGGSLGQQPTLGNRSVAPRGSVGDTTDMHELPKPASLTRSHSSLARPTTSPGSSPPTAMNGSLPVTDMPRLISNSKSPVLPRPSKVLSGGSCTMKKRNADRLTIPMDDKVLDAVNIYVRKYCIQLFEEVLADDAKPVVGFHCYYCKELSQDGSHDQAKWHLKDYNTIFEKVRDYQQHHLNTCPCFPVELKARYHSLIQQEYWNQKKTSSPAFLRAYYAEAAAELGLVESPHGLMFSSEPEECVKASARLKSLVGLIG